VPELVFKENQLRVAGFALDAPLVYNGQQKLYRAVKDLTHDQLVTIAHALELPTHGLIDTFKLFLVVAGELQVAWFTEMGAVPPNIMANHEARIRDYHKELVELKDKGEVMKTKVKAAAAAKKEKVVKKAMTYSILRSKLVGSKLAKKVEDEKATSHVPVVAQVLLSKPDKSWTLADVLDAVKATKRYTTKSGGAPTEANVRGDLNVLEKEGLVKVTEAA
jgi:hypothetical protein